MTQYTEDKAHWSGALRADPDKVRQAFWVVLQGQTYLEGQRVVLTLERTELDTLSYAEVDARAVALANRGGH